MARRKEEEHHFEVPPDYSEVYLECRGVAHQWEMQRPLYSQTDEDGNRIIMPSYRCRRCECVREDTYVNAIRTRRRYVHPADYRIGGYRSADLPMVRWSLLTRVVEAQSKPRPKKKGKGRR